MVIILDFGHGGLDDNGHYVTAPSKMFKFKDGKVVYEGVLNRQIGNKIKKELEKDGRYKILTTQGNNKEYIDVPLKERVNFANKQDSKNSIVVSIHNNAGGGSGIEIYTSVGKTKSDTLATYVMDKLKPIYLKNKLPIREDFSDKDSDKEVDFYILRKTKSPAILIEFGFFDSEIDIKYLEDEEFQKEIAKSTAEAIICYIQDNKLK